MCGVCDRIQAIREGTNPWFIRELQTGYVVLGDNQHFRGYCLFLCKQCVSELHLLPDDFKMKFLEEMSWVAEAACRAFHPDKLNYEMLGNGMSHMHWHLFPRVAGDTPRPGPVWWMKPEDMYAQETLPSPDEREQLKAQLALALEDVLKKHEATA